jgi:hypothetical protein
MSIYKDFDNYLIFKEGMVFNIKRNKFMKEQLSKGGYKWIRLCKNGKLHGLKIHRLVALVYIPNPLNKEMVNHIDGNKLNNNVSNLEWNTRSENGCNLNNGLSKNNKSGIRGVLYDRQRNQWRANLRKNGKLYQKRFKTLEEAISYRKDLEEIHFGFNSI